MDIQVAEKTVRAKFSKYFDENKAIESVFKKIQVGTATFDDAQLFAENIGEVLVDAFGDLVKSSGFDLDLDEVAEQIVSKMLTQNYRFVTLVCDTVQANLNAAAKVGLEGVEPKVDTNAINTIKNKVKAAKTPEELQVALGENITTFSQQVVDRWVMNNAEFAAKSGIGAVVVRKWSGKYGSHDTKHTDWCHSLAGVYQYDNTLDKRVFVRHTGCRCSVSYYPQGSLKGKITSLEKGTSDADKVLWNTDKVFSYTRKAVRRREIKRYGKEYAKKLLNEEWKGGRNGQAERHFT